MLTEVTCSSSSSGEVLLAITSSLDAASFTLLGRTTTAVDTTWRQIFAYSCAYRRRSAALSIEFCFSYSPTTQISPASNASLSNRAAINAAPLTVNDPGTSSMEVKTPGVCRNLSGGISLSALTSKLRKICSPPVNACRKSRVRFRIGKSGSRGQGL